MRACAHACAANTDLEVVVVLLLVLADAVPVGPLRVGVNVHLDDTVCEGLADLLLLRARAAMEHKEDGLGLLRLKLLLHILL